MFRRTLLICLGCVLCGLSVESGDVRMHPSGSEPWLPIKQISVPLTTAQVQTLFSAPIEILPAKPGIVYIPFHGLMVRNGSTVFTSVTGNLQIQAVASTPVALISRPIAFLTDAGTYTSTFQTPANNALVGEEATRLGGKALQLKLDTEDAADGSPVTIHLWYWEVPTQGF